MVAVQNGLEFPGVILDWTVLLSVEIKIKVV